MRTYDGFSFGNFVRRYPDLRNTVTDLLIGDLFTDRVDKVWGPMESLYEPGKKEIPTWKQGAPQDQVPGKANDRVAGWQKTVTPSYQLSIISSHWITEAFIDN